MAASYRIVFPIGLHLNSLHSIMGQHSEEEIQAANSRIAAYNRVLREYEDELRLVAILLFGKNKKKSAHQMYKDRQLEGAHCVLIDRHLIDDETQFRNYFRLSPCLYSRILATIEQDLDGIRTNFIPKPINAQQKLCITLR